MCTITNRLAHILLYKPQFKNRSKSGRAVVPDAAKNKNNMKTVSLSGSLRANVGSKDAAETRGKGLVPCVLYGGKEQIHFSADIRDFKNLVYTPDVAQVDLNIEGRNFKAIVQEVQYHKLNDQIIHVDFLELVPGKAVTMAIPVKLNGQAEGVKAGGKLVLKQRKLRVKGIPEKLPTYVELNIESLAIGRGIAIGDIKIEGCELIQPKNITVVTVESTRAAAAAEAEEKKAAPAATPAATPAAAKK
jgi:large subunit ribosomal protein L25